MLGNVLGTVGLAGASGVLGFMGAKETNRSNRVISREQMQFNKQEAQLNRNFQERMSNTAISRRYLDMKKAGINPILAGRSDASTPGGATASGAVIPAVNEMEPALAGAKGVTRLVEEIKNLKETNKLLKAQEENTSANTWKTKNEASYYGQLAERTKAEAEVKSVAIPRAKFEESLKSDFFEQLQKVWDKYNPTQSTAKGN